MALPSFAGPSDAAVSESEAGALALEAIFLETGPLGLGADCFPLTATAVFEGALKDEALEDKALEDEALGAADLDDDATGARELEAGAWGIAALGRWT